MNDYDIAEEVSFITKNGRLWRTRADAIYHSLVCAFDEAHCDCGYSSQCARPDTAMLHKFTLIKRWRELDHKSPAEMPPGYNPRIDLDHEQTRLIDFFENEIAELPKCVYSYMSTREPRRTKTGIGSHGA